MIPLNTRTPPEKLTPVVRKLVLRRRLLQIRQKDLASTMGYSVGAIKGWEQGNTVPTYQSLLDWCQALGVELCCMEKRI